MMMKLAVSNVCWHHNEIRDFLKLIAGLGCEGVELAPSMIWPEPVHATQEERNDLRKLIEDNGLRTTGIQALLFTHPELKIFEGANLRQRTYEYFLQLMDLCRDLGGEVLVYGSPRSRLINERDRPAANTVSVEFFRNVGQAAAERQVFFCIEPLGRTETNFINTVKEAESIIDAVGSLGLGLHIDAKALIDEEEWTSTTIRESFSRAKHFHVNDPGLQPPGATGFDHAKIASIVGASGYSRFVSIEMRRNDADVSGTVVRAVNYVQQVYLENRL